MSFLSHVSAGMVKENKFFRACAYGLFGIGTFALPLIGVPAMRDPLLLPKTLAWFAVALLVLLVWLLSVTLFKEVSVRRSALDIPLLLFLG